MTNNNTFIVPDGVEYIGSDNIKLFIDHPEQIKHLILPVGLKTIGSLRVCRSLESVIIPEGVISIEDFAFADCDALKSLHIPASVTEIGKDLFGMQLYRQNLKLSAPPLKSLTVEKGNTIYDSRNGCNAIIRTADGALLYGCKFSVIPEGVVTICDSAFHGCKIQKVMLPRSVRTIGEKAFKDCHFLKEVVLNDGLEEIGRESLCRCYPLNSDIIPSSMRAPLPLAEMAPLTHWCARTVGEPDDKNWRGAAFKECFNLKMVSLPRQLTYTRVYDKKYQTETIKRSSVPGVAFQLGIIKDDSVQVFGDVPQGLRAEAWYRVSKVDIIIRKMGIPKSTSILLDLDYSEYHMICKVTIAFLESISHYEYENGQFGSCRMDDPFQEHLAGVYLSDHPVVKSWKSCKSLDDGIKYELDRYKEELSAILAGARKIELQDLWP